jgi:ABC-2 type transport system permease protein
VNVIGAELLKLRRSRGTWVIIAVLAAVELLLGYGLPYLIAQVEPPEGQPDFGETLLLTIRPEFFVSNVLNMLGFIGAALALVLGAMHSAREYGLRTVTSMLTQGPGRTVVLIAKAASLAVILAVMVVVAFVVGALASLLFGALADAPLEFPPLTQVASGAAAGFLIVAAWGALGLALGFLLRSTGLAIGLGLVYALVVETIIQGFAGFNTVVEAISRALLGVNGSALAASFGPDAVAEEFGVIDVAPVVAALVLAAYIVVSLAAAAVVFARRDVT